MSEVSCQTPCCEWNVGDPKKVRVDQLRLLGNGVMPQTAEKAFRSLMMRIGGYNNGL